MLTPNEVAERTFHTTRFSGYKTEEVDDFMDAITEDYGTLYKENAILKGKIKVLVDKINEYRATEDDMRMTLMTARRTADSIRSEAERERKELFAAVDGEVEQYRAQLRQDIAEAEQQREQARAATAEFLAKLQELVRAQAAFLEQLPHQELVKGEEGDAVADTAAAIGAVMDAAIAEDTAGHKSDEDYVSDEPTRVIDLGSNHAEVDYEM